MSQKKVRVPLPHPAPDNPRRGAWVFVLIGVFLLLLVGGLGFLLVDSVVQGQIVTGNRVGPRRIYTLATEPGRFWFEIVMHGLIALVLAALAVAAFWISRVLMGTAAKHP